MIRVDEDFKESASTIMVFLLSDAVFRVLPFLKIIDFLFWVLKHGKGDLPVR